jgi:hypothetical protein
MKNFKTIEEAEKYAIDYFAEHHDYFGEFEHFNNKGLIKFYSINSPNKYHTFQCTVFASEPVKRPVGRPKGPEKVYVGFKIEPKYHAEVKAMVKKYIADKKN